jgi:hypothetical protein
MKIRTYRDVRFASDKSKGGRGIEITAFRVCVILSRHGFFWGRV